MLRNSLDEENYVGSRLNLLEFSSVAETTGTLFVDFDRMNPEGEAYLMVKHCTYSKGVMMVLKLLG